MIQTNSTASLLIHETPYTPTSYLPLSSTDPDFIAQYFFFTDSDRIDETVLVQATNPLPYPINKPLDPSYSDPMNDLVLYESFEATSLRLVHRPSI